MPEHTATVPLSSPIKAHGQETSELRIRRPRAKELRRASESCKADSDEKLAFYSYLLAECAGVPLSSIDQLELEDWRLAVEKLAALMPDELRPETDELGKAKAGGDSPS